MTTYHWKGEGAAHTGDWETTTDWTPNGDPGAGDMPYIDLGVVTEDVNQPQLLPNNTVNPGVEIAAFNIGPNGQLVIGDAAGTNHAIITDDGSSTSVLRGKIAIYAGSELRASGTINTGVAGSTDGTVAIDGGQLLAVGSLVVNGAGTIAMDGGYIGGSSIKPKDTFVNYVTIEGVGSIDAANYYAAPPANPLSGPLNYKGLTTVNRGTIDATNVNNVGGPDDVLWVSGGVVDNFGLMEATDSVAGSTGVAALNIDYGAVVNNESGGTISAGDIDAAVYLAGGTINNGALSGPGSIDVTGTGNHIDAVGKGGELKNTGKIDAFGALTVSVGSGASWQNNGHINVYSGGTMNLNGTFDNNLGAVITSDGGKVTSGATSSILNSGDLVAEDGGHMTLNGAVVGPDGTMTLDDGIMTLTNITKQGTIQFDTGDNHLVFENGGNDGNIFDFDLETGTYAQDGDVINLRDVAYSPSVATFTQESSTTSLLQVGSYSLLLDGGLYSPEIGVAQAASNVFDISKGAFNSAIGTNSTDISYRHT